MTDTPRTGTPIGRRVVLGIVGLGVAGVAAGRWLSEGVSDVVSAAAPGLAGVIPAAGGFRIYTVTGGYPEFNPATYRLSVSGLVDQPLSLSLTDLDDLPQTQMTKDFQCVTGWRVDDVPWSGVLLRDVIDAAGVEAGATALKFTSFDGVYTESLTLEQAQRDDVLVATSMYGKPIELKHGAPVRLIAAPMYAYKFIKWMDGIELTRTVEPGYWEVRGYDIDAWVGESNGRSDDPVV
ncbi:MAG: molybdopterin-dependent oxidoreductase [Candidatus Nanopelagicales bacterium]|nr:molybdopterin-dependent oxidoreductase [Candidatus Nanopelagicales bacterium]MCF8537582.1 molybdopterin-dependent oxidoreductase [Candidatus Nanopelagicales bacterium]MCF8542564.1 molybdopterin-dependent oxidoreductase [Candidatus Nanopelagicales bacterium]MCF8557400.1 molybdopterin-dependent oxidoreductase [Candidatus Nanopelagicales bacterium]